MIEVEVHCSDPPEHKVVHAIPDFEAAIFRVVERKAVGVRRVTVPLSAGSVAVLLGRPSQSFRSLVDTQSDREHRKFQEPADDQNGRSQTN